MTAERYCDGEKLKYVKSKRLKLSKVIYFQIFPKIENTGGRVPS